MNAPEFYAPGAYVAVMGYSKDKVKSIFFTYPGEGKGSCSAGVSAAGYFIEVLKRDALKVIYVMPAFIFGNKCERIIRNGSINKGCP